MKRRVLFLALFIILPLLLQDALQANQKKVRREKYLRFHEISLCPKQQNPNFDVKNLSIVMLPRGITGFQANVTMKEEMPDATEAKIRLYYSSSYSEPHTREYFATYVMRHQCNDILKAMGFRDFETVRPDAYRSCPWKKGSFEIRSGPIPLNPDIVNFLTGIEGKYWRIIGTFYGGKTFINCLIIGAEIIELVSF